MKTFRQSPNYTKSDGTRKVGFVIHGTLGKYEGAVEWLCTPANRRNPVTYSSAHYVIAKDGRCTQLVKNEDVSWHAGTVSNPSPYAKKVLQKNWLGVYKNPNSYLIGIECEWFPGQQLTEAQYKVIFDILKDTGIRNPIVIGHKDIASYKADDMEFACKIIRSQLIKPMETTGNATQYEIVSKETNVSYPVTQMAFGEEEVTTESQFGTVVFSNINKAGDLQNPLYSIREVGTNMSPDGTHVVA